MGCCPSILYLFADHEQKSLKEGREMKKFLVSTLYKNDDFKDAETNIAKSTSNKIWSILPQGWDRLEPKS